MNKNFKEIIVVPSANDFIDIVLSKTQRKTPTVVRKGWKISRIRSFYARKIKFTQQECHDRFTAILDGFPIVEELHPFYSDLINVLYSRDHYKLALGQINTARQTIDNISKDYVRLIKYGESLYHCKQLKRAALGRMATMLKKCKTALGFLEHVRQHLSRLPQIDPGARTLLITGYPNVGKSSFINKITRANVDVQPYAFTTKSIFVGHYDYDYQRYQVIDTPGILDRPLDERNTIEMQAITALAHLNSCILYFIDISEECGFSIEQQVSLYHNIKPLFANKPMLVIANKTDVRKWDDLSAEHQQLVSSVADDRNVQIIQMSNMSEEGIANVTAAACSQLREHRLLRKMKSNKIDDIKNRLVIQRPTPRDNRSRPAVQPKGFLRRKKRVGTGPSGTTDIDNNGMDMEGEKRRTLRDVEIENGGPGVFDFDFRNHHDLADDDWKFDTVPEIYDGKNVADFYDPDIEEKLTALEQEEELRQKEYDLNYALDSDSDMDEETLRLVREVRKQKKLLINKSILKNNANRIIMPRTAHRINPDQMEEDLARLGVNASRVRGRSKKRMASVLGNRESSKSRGRETSRSRSRSRTASVLPGDGLKNDKTKHKVIKLSKIAQRKPNLNARSGEGDRRNYDLMPKHLFSGKAGFQRDYR